LFEDRLDGFDEPILPDPPLSPTSPQQQQQQNDFDFDISKYIHEP
jgi:hypothetical protein